MEDAVAYQVYVAAAEKGAYCAQISTDPLFSDVDTVAMTAVSGSPCDYRAVFYGITPVMWNTPVYFRVLNADGDIVSPVVTYSVTSYIVRMLEKESSSGDEQDSTPVLHAMLALYEAAVAYQQI